MGASLLVLKNKSDIAGCMSGDELREVRARVPILPCNMFVVMADTRSQALRLDDIKTHQWHIMECSAMSGLNVQEGLDWVVQDGKNRLFLY